MQVSCLHVSFSVNTTENPGSLLSRSERRLWRFNVDRLGSLFDPKADLSISEHIRPHWSQAGAIVFITFRTHDSIPREVLDRWEKEKQEWIRRLGFSIDQHWSDVLPTLDPERQHQFKKEFNRCREDFLDRCHGDCVLRKPELAKIVADTLMHFDGIRYRMGDFVVMPNHVHLMASFGSEDAVVSQCDSWLHYSARQIKLARGSKGKFWQQESERRLWGGFSASSRGRCFRRSRCLCCRRG